MQCPWCRRETGLPPMDRRGATCPYGAGKLTYAFRGRKAFLYLCIGGAVALIRMPFTGPVVFLLAILGALVSSAYLDKWF